MEMQQLPANTISPGASAESTENNNASRIFFLMKFGVLATSVLVDISKITVQRLGSNIALSHCLMNNVKLAGFACCAKVIKPDL